MRAAPRASGRCGRGRAQGENGRIGGVGDVEGAGGNWRRKRWEGRFIKQDSDFGVTLFSPRSPAVGDGGRATAEGATPSVIEKLALVKRISLFGDMNLGLISALE